MESIQKLTEYFQRFPGIGPRQARRFTYFLLRQNSQWIDEFIRELTAVRSASKICIDCHRHFISTGNEMRCPICADTSRSPETLMVVEKEVDLESIEKSRAYHGHYYVLGGTISPLEERDAEASVAGLVRRIDALRKSNVFKEVILALSATTEGDDTAEYLIERLSALSQEKGFTITALGRGLSTGSEIEYVDSKTLKDALSHRTQGVQ